MKRKTAKKLFMAAFGLLLGVILAEMALRMHAAVEERRVPRKTYVDQPAATGAIRMAVLGGSTSNGSPFADVMGKSPVQRFNLLSVTRFLLEKRYGCPAVAIDNYAGPNWSAQTTTDHYFERPGSRPDVLVLYTGQNETTQYYSPNMVPPPEFLEPLARLQSGNLLLRRLFTRQVVPSDQRYTGKFFSDNVIPPYEQEHSLIRFRHAVERMIRYTAAEGIFLVVVIPQSNYLFPPTRSVYDGPADRKSEALSLFKQAWQARYLENQPDRGLAILEQLHGFCGFADLFYELGKLNYSRGNIDAALPLLRQARETDGFATCITPAYREILRELVKRHGVPHIDMDALIRDNLGRPVPDYASFLDDCHLDLDVYLELSRQIIRVMREHGFEKVDLPPKDLDLTREEWAEQLGITQRVWLEAVLWEANYHADQVNYTFRKLDSLEQAQSYLRKIKEQGLPGMQKALDESLAAAERMIQAEAERMRKWVQHEGPMPIGEPDAGEAPEGFGGRAEIETSQGDVFMDHGEWELAIGRYRAALAIDPDFVRAHLNLGAALCNVHQFEKAVQAFERVLELEPQHLSAHRNLGKALLDLGRFDDALAHHREALRTAPGDNEVQQEYYVAVYKLAWWLATSPNADERDGDRAVTLAEEVCRVTQMASFEALDALAAAYAETGRFQDAVAAATRALELARQWGDPRADAIARRLAGYKTGQPWREEMVSR